jgi:hypothetical protein
MKEATEKISRFASVGLTSLLNNRFCPEYHIGSKS